MNRKIGHRPGSWDTPGKPGNKMPKITQGPEQNIRKTLFGRGKPVSSSKEEEKPNVWCLEEMHEGPHTVHWVIM